MRKLINDKVDSWERWLIRKVNWVIVTYRSTHRQTTLIVKLLSRLKIGSFFSDCHPIYLSNQSPFSRINFIINQLSHQCTLFIFSSTYCNFLNFWSCFDYTGIYSTCSDNFKIWNQGKWLKIHVVCHPDIISCSLLFATFCRQSRLWQIIWE